MPIARARARVREINGDTKFIKRAITLGGIARLINKWLVGERLPHRK